MTVRRSRRSPGARSPTTSADQLEAQHPRRRAGAGRDAAERGRAGRELGVSRSSVREALRDAGRARARRAARQPAPTSSSTCPTVRVDATCARDADPRGVRDPPRCSRCSWPSTPRRGPRRPSATRSSTWRRAIGRRADVEALRPLDRAFHGADRRGGRQRACSPSCTPRCSTPCSPRRRSTSCCTASRLGRRRRAILRDERPQPRGDRRGGRRRRRRARPAPPPAPTSTTSRPACSTADRPRGPVPGTGDDGLPSRVRWPTVGRPPGVCSGGGPDQGRAGDRRRGDVGTGHGTGRDGCGRRLPPTGADARGARHRRPVLPARRQRRLRRRRTTTSTSRYDPATDVLAGVARSRRRATQDLSALQPRPRGPRRCVGQGRRPRRPRGAATATSSTVTPPRGLRKRPRVHDRGRATTACRSRSTTRLGLSGFIPTDDGALVAGQPHVAATWFPVNDHPSDTASYTSTSRCPPGLEAVANGVLAGQRTRTAGPRGRGRPQEPMASYLATPTIGEFDLDAYRDGRHPVLGRHRPRPVRPAVHAAHRRRSSRSPRRPDISYKRLTRTIDVPAGGGDADVLGRPATPSRTGTTSSSRPTPPAATTGRRCPTPTAHTDQRHRHLVPVLARPPPVPHPLPDRRRRRHVRPTGTTGDVERGDRHQRRLRSSGRSTSAPTPARQVEISLTYASDDIVQRRRVDRRHRGVDRRGQHVVRGRRRPLDGWTVPGPPRAARATRTTGSSARPGRPAADTSATIAAASFARQPEILDFLAGYFGPYPFNAAGGIVDDVAGARLRPREPDPADLLAGLLHRLDLGRLRRRPRARPPVVRRQPAPRAVAGHLAQRGLRHLRRVAVERARGPRHPAGDLRLLRHGDPGRRPVLGVADRRPRPGPAVRARCTTAGDDAARAAPTVGDETSSGSSRRGPGAAGEAVSTAEFIALAEPISRQDLDDLFDTWLYTPAKPPELGPAASAGSPRTDSGAGRRGRRAAAVADRHAERTTIRVRWSPVRCRRGDRGSTVGSPAGWPAFICS